MAGLWHEIWTNPWWGLAVYLFIGLCVGCFICATVAEDEGAKAKWLYVVASLALWPILFIIALISIMV